MGLLSGTRRQTLARDCSLLLVRRLAVVLHQLVDATRAEALNLSRREAAVHRVRVHTRRVGRGSCALRHC